MNNFDKRFNAILNEAGGFMGALGSAAKGVTNVASAVGSGLNAAKNPGQGVSNALGGLVAKGKEAEALKEQPFSLKNPPKIGQIVITKSSIYGLGQPKMNSKGVPLPPQLITLIPSATIFGKITTKINPQDATYGVGLTDEKGTASTKYFFGKTEDAPYWQIYDYTKTPDTALMKDPATGNLCKSNAIMVGIAKDDVSDPLRRWVDYQQYLNQLRQGKGA